MAKKWIVINAMLLLLAGFLGWRLRSSARSFKVANDIGKIQPAKDLKLKIAVEGVMPPMQPPAQYNLADYGVIPAQNLFSDTRSKEDKVEAAPVVPEVPPLAVKPILVGVSLSGDQKVASVVDPSAGAAARRSQPKRLGDSYQGYTINDITKDQMVLERGNRREVIPLFDAAKHPAQGAASQSGRTPILPTRVVAFGGGASSGQSVAQPVSGGARAVPMAVSSTGGQAVPGAGRTTAAQPGRQGIPAVQQPAATPPQTEPRPTRIIKTPFGDVPIRPDNY